MPDAKQILAFTDNLISTSPLPLSSAVSKAGELHQGHFNASQYNYLEGSVSVPAFPKPVLLIGREDMNRATNGDIVVVEVSPKNEWKAPADEVVDQVCECPNSFLKHFVDVGDD